jgi:hypothetical protein
MASAGNGRSRRAVEHVCGRDLKGTCVSMTDHIESDEPEVDDTEVEREDDEQVERAPQPGNTPEPGSPPYDSTLPRERDEQ